MARVKNSLSADAVMRDIAEGRISRAAAARRLGGISVRQVNRLMRKHGVKRPPGRSVWRRLTALARREAKERAARAVIAGQYGPLYASRAAGCSVRTIYRWVAVLKKRPKTLRNARKTTKNAQKVHKNSRS